MWEEAHKYQWYINAFFDSITPLILPYLITFQQSSWIGLQYFYLTPNESDIIVCKLLQVYMTLLVNEVPWAY